MPQRLAIDRHGIDPMAMMFRAVDTPQVVKMRPSYTMRCLYTPPGKPFCTLVHHDCDCKSHFVFSVCLLVSLFLSPLLSLSRFRSLLVSSSHPLARATTTTHPECPVCNKCIPSVILEAHVDRCVERQFAAASGRACVLCMSAFFCMFGIHLSLCRFKVRRCQ